MYDIDENFINDVGLGGMSEENKKKLIEDIRVELEIRVGDELTKNLDDDQILEFDKILESSDKVAILKWMQKHCPDYEAVVRRNISALKQDIVDNKEHFITT